MSTYKRLYIAGGCYFFTLVTHQRKPIFSNRTNIDLLYNAFSYTRDKKPFKLNAIVILPDHLHCIWTMPDDDANFSSRWQMIKTFFSRKLHSSIDSRITVWQPRFWEHLIRNEKDFRNHIDYIHYNPVKHGLVDRPDKWQSSTFNKFVKKGWYERGWGEHAPENIRQIELE